jgi:hypothetical protein
LELIGEIGSASKKKTWTQDFVDLSEQSPRGVAPH